MLAWNDSSASAERQILVSGLVWNPHDPSHLIMPDCVSAGIALISPHAYAKNPSGRDAVIDGSFCRSEPAAELRGLAKICPPVSAWRWLSARNACLVM